MNKIPKPFTDFVKSHPEIAEAYENLSEKCQESGPLDQRERLLVKLGIAIGSGVEGSVRSQVRKALDAGAGIIGVNNRDLRTFEVSLDVSLDLAPLIPGGRRRAYRMIYCLKAMNLLTQVGKRGRAALYRQTQSD